MQSSLLSMLGWRGGRDDQNPSQRTLFSVIFVFSQHKGVTLCAGGGSYRSLPAPLRTPSCISRTSERAVDSRRAPERTPVILGFVFKWKIGGLKCLRFQLQLCKGCIQFLRNQPSHQRIKQSVLVSSGSPTADSSLRMQNRAWEDQFIKCYRDVQAVPKTTCKSFKIIFGTE